MKQVIGRVVDEGDYLEVQPHFAENIVCGFARLGGHSIGVVGNQPGALAGVLDIDASVKAARSSGRATPSTSSSPSSTFRASSGHGARSGAGSSATARRLLYAYAEATVPKLTVITRKAYGGAYDVMSSKHIRADYNVAWPTAEVAVMGPESAVNIVFRNELEDANDPATRRAELIDDYKERFANPYAAAERGYVDDVIEHAARVPYSSRRSRPRSRSASWSPKRNTGTSLCDRVAACARRGRRARLRRRQGRPPARPRARGICDRRMWDDVWPDLARRYRVARFDMRGYGDSAVAAAPYAPHDDVVAVLDHLGFERAVLCGVSFGGAVELDVALAAPERVHALVLVCCSARGMPPPAELRAHHGRSRRSRGRGDIDVAVELELRIWVDGVGRPAPADPSVRERVRQMNRRAWERALEGAAPVPLDPPASQRLADIAPPTLGSPASTTSPGSPTHAA